MAVTEWLRLALGGAVARPHALPAPPRLVLIAPYKRDAQLWLRDNELREREVYIVTRADRLRGLGGPLDVVWLNWHRWPSLGEYDRVCLYVDMLASRGNINSEVEAYT